MRSAAFPVGAAIPKRKILPWVKAIAVRMETSLATDVVLPVPGPPVITASG